MIIGKRDRNILLGITPPNLTFYLKQVAWEEIIFRVWGVIGLYQIFGWWIAILITTVVWSLLHLIGFKWQMMVATIILGIGLGWCMSLPVPFNSMLAFGIHLLFGWAGYKIGLIQKWIR